MLDTVQAYRVWLIDRLASTLEAEPTDFDLRVHLSRYGLDSAKAISLTAALSKETGRQLKPTLFWQYSTIESLARFLAGVDQPQQTQASPEPHSQKMTEPIAVVGMACRFPNAPNPNAFWSLLADGSEAIVEIPADR